MKPILILALLLCLGLSASAQETRGGQTLMESQAARRDKEPPKPPTKPAKPTGQILGKRVTYGGFFTDFFKAERKRPLLSLRTPIDPQKDLENLWFYPGTDRIQGVVLFSFQF